jgi:hypothetical protein
VNIINVYFLSDIAMKLMFVRRLADHSDMLDFATEMMHDKQYTNVAGCDLSLSGREAAEEMFDLSNNPSRCDERRVIFGNKRSLSVGDIVQVNVRLFACFSTGWVDL